MLDIQYIRDNKELVQKTVRDKGADVDVVALIALDDRRREKITATETLRAERNEIAASMKGGKPAPELIEKGKQLKEKVAELEAALSEITVQYEKLLAEVPNMPSDDTPIGASENENIVLKTVGEKPQFDFEPKAHWDMPQFVEEERATKISGARFAFIKGGMAALQLALINWGMQQISDEAVLKRIADEANLEVSTKPFMPMLPPVMMRTNAYAATSRLKPDDITFRLANDDLWLVGSSEHSMCAYYMNDTIDGDDLPVRFAGYSPAFRREVGSAGKDTRGILRVHQFNKLEMESFTDEASSRVEHEFMIAIQEYLMRQLELPYRVVLKCTADMGGPNVRGVDIDTWMPGQNAYRETHSADYIGDYQTRGLNTKYKNKEGARVLAHTNDATAIADRTLIAIIENNQNKDGTVNVPVVLQPFMGGRKVV